MGWASQSILRLQHGETIQIRPRGSSMKGKIESGQLCTIEPIQFTTIEVGDIVLCKVQGDRYQIGNNRGHINGWIGPKGIFGKCISVEL